MKTFEEVQEARKKIILRTVNEPLHTEQRLLLQGMLNALVWVADNAPQNCTAIQRILDGEQFK